MRLGWIAMLGAGCVFHVPAEVLDGDEPEVSLGMEPDTLEAGRTLVEISDAYVEADFRDVWDVRSMGDFSVLEWEGGRDRLDVVLEVSGGADGEQQLAIELGDQTAFVSFTAH